MRYSQLGLPSNLQESPRELNARVRVRGPARTGPGGPEGSRIGYTQVRCLGSNSGFGASLTSPINSACCCLSHRLWWPRAKFCDFTNMQLPHFPYEDWPYPTCLEVTRTKVHLSSYLNLWTVAVQPSKHCLTQIESRELTDLFTFCFCFFFVVFFFQTESIQP